jgi:DNA-binding PadR family transcriptional regulator
MQSPVYDQICEYIKTKHKKRHRGAVFLIFSELLQGNELGRDYLVSKQNPHTKNKIEHSTMEILLKKLVDDNLIVIDKYCNRFLHIANHFTLTENGHAFVTSSKIAYKNYSDFQYRRNGITSGHLIQKLQNTSHASFCDDWKTKLPDSQETNRFLDGLTLLESREVVFQRFEALMHPKMAQALYITRSIPSETQFNIVYRPLKSGRLQSRPHTYIGKELVQFIRPAEDQHLQNGMLFSLDYSSQELRILANMLPSDSPIAQWAKEPNNSFAELLDIYNITIPVRLWKAFMYAFLYGSEGYALANQLNYSEVLEMGFDSSIKASKSIVANFIEKVPEVVSLRQQFAHDFMNTKTIVAPGGFTRIADGGELKKDGTIKKNKSLTIPLSHIIQGTGAYIARTLISRSPSLKCSRLFLPIHDGFVFYCKKEDYAAALAEASTLLTDVAREIVPNVAMPNKLEWVRGQEV